MANSGDETLRRAFGSALVDLRKRRRISQEQLALQTGMDRSYVGGLENGLHNPTLDTIYRLCPVLKISLRGFMQFIERYL